MKDDTNDKEDMSDMLSIVVVTKSPTQKKDEQAIRCNYEETRMLQSESNVEENVLVNIFIIQKRRMLKGIWL